MLANEYSFIEGCLNDIEVKLKQQQDIQTCQKEAEHEQTIREEQAENQARIRKANEEKAEQHERQRKVNEEQAERYALLRKANEESIIKHNEEIRKMKEIEKQN